MSDVPVVNDYAYGFHDDAEIIFSTGKGLSEEVIRTISKEKGEPEWMLDYRLRSLKVFLDSKLPDWGPDLSALDFDDIIYLHKKEFFYCFTGQVKRYSKFKKIYLERY